MLPYALRRLVLALPLLLGITLISFCLMHLAPGEPTDMGSADPPTTSDKEMRDRLGQEWGLDKPLHVQYWNWVTRIVQLDFGRSFSPDARPVLQKIRERLPITLLLNLVEMMIIVALAIPIGVVIISTRDRKSTRLNSSHDQISYAVFCLKKKKQDTLYAC